MSSIVSTNGSHSSERKWRILCFSSKVWHLSLLSKYSSFPTHSVPTVPTPLVFLPCLVVPIFFHLNCLCGLPKFRASSLEHMLQSHPITLHILSAITSNSKSEFIFTIICQAIREVLLQHSAQMSSFPCKNGIHELSPLFPIKWFTQELSGCMTNSRSHNTKYCRRIPPPFCTLFHQNLCAICILSSKHCCAFPWRFRGHPRISSTTSLSHVTCSNSLFCAKRVKKHSQLRTSRESLSLRRTGHPSPQRNWASCAIVFSRPSLLPLVTPPGLSRKSTPKLTGLSQLTTSHQPLWPIPPIWLFLLFQRPLFVFARTFQRNPWSSWRSTPRLAVFVVGRDHRCIDGQLRSGEERQTLDHHFQPSAIKVVVYLHIHVSDKNVCPYTCSCLPADPCCDRLQCPCSSSQHPHRRARCSVVSKGVDWTATPATAEGQWEREAKAAEEQEAEWLRIKPRDSISWETDQRRACHRPRVG